MWAYLNRFMHPGVEHVAAGTGKSRGYRQCRTSSIRFRYTKKNHPPGGGWNCEKNQGWIKKFIRPSGCCLLIRAGKRPSGIRPLSWRTHGLR